MFGGERRWGYGGGEEKKEKESCEVGEEEEEDNCEVREVEKEDKCEE